MKVSRERVEEWLAARVAAETGLRVREVRRDSTFASFGVDSVKAFEVTSELSEYTGVSLPVTLFWEQPTIAAVSDFVASRVAVEIEP